MEIEVRDTHICPWVNVRLSPHEARTLCKVLGFPVGKGIWGHRVAQRFAEGLDEAALEAHDGTAQSVTQSEDERAARSCPVSGAQSGVIVWCGRQIREPAMQTDQW